MRKSDDLRKSLPTRQRHVLRIPLQLTTRVARRYLQKAIRAVLESTVEVEVEVIVVIEVEVIVVIEVETEIRVVIGAGEVIIIIIIIHTMNVVEAEDINHSVYNYFMCLLHVMCLFHRCVETEECFLIERVVNAANRQNGITSRFFFFI